MTYGHKWYVHKVEWFSALSNIQWEQGCQKIVSDQSRTIFCDYQFLMEAKIVIDQSMTIFCDNPFLMEAKIVIDWSMTVL